MGAQEDGQDGQESRVRMEQFSERQCYIISASQNSMKEMMYAHFFSATRCSVTLISGDTRTGAPRSAIVSCREFLRGPELDDSLTRISEVMSLSGR